MNSPAATLIVARKAQEEKSHQQAGSAASRLTVSALGMFTLFSEVKFCDAKVARLPLPVAEGRLRRAPSTVDERRGRALFRS